MQVSFGNIIKESFLWMVNILFKTFCLRKWIALTFIAIMAGYLSFNMNLNLPGNKTNNNSFRSCPSAGIIFQSAGLVEADEAQEMPTAIEQEPLEDMTEAEEPYRFLDEPADYIVLSVLVIIFIIIMILFTWLSSRFRFIFIEDIINNDGSIKIPWVNNTFIGNQLFIFYLIYGFVYLGIIGLIIFRVLISLNALGAFSQNTNVSFFKVAASIMPHIFMFILLLFLAGLIYFFIENLVTPIMYKKKESFIACWNEAGALLKKNVGNFFAFFFINIGLGFGAVIATGLIILTYIALVILLGALVVMLTAAILSILPLGLKVVIGFVFGLIAIVGLICLFFIANMLLLPMAVFFRTLGLKFIAALDKGYDLFK
jgi:hypothetical protein